MRLEIPGDMGRLAKSMIDTSAFVVAHRLPRFGGGYNMTVAQEALGTT